MKKLYSLTIVIFLQLSESSLFAEESKATNKESDENSIEVYKFISEGRVDPAKGEYINPSLGLKIPGIAKFKILTHKDLLNNIEKSIEAKLIKNTAKDRQIARLGWANTFAVMHYELPNGAIGSMNCNAFLAKPEDTPKSKVQNMRDRIIPMIGKSKFVEILKVYDTEEFTLRGRNFHSITFDSKRKMLDKKILHTTNSLIAVSHGNKLITFEITNPTSASGKLILTELFKAVARTEFTKQKAENKAQ